MGAAMKEGQSNGSNPSMVSGGTGPPQLKHLYVRSWTAWKGRTNGERRVLRREVTCGELLELRSEARR